MGDVYNVSLLAEGLHWWQDLLLGWSPATQWDCLRLDELASAIGLL